MELFKQNVSREAFRQLLVQPINEETILYIIYLTSRATYGSASRGPTCNNHINCLSNLIEQEVSLNCFVRTVVATSGTRMSTLMGAMVYLSRMTTNMRRTQSCRNHEPSHLTFMACLILAAKYLNDVSPSNQQWARYCTVATRRCIVGICALRLNDIEREFLKLLHWDLRITIHDLQAVLEPLLAPAGNWLYQKSPHISMPAPIPCNIAVDSFPAQYCSAACIRACVCQECIVGNRKDIHSLV